MKKKCISILLIIAICASGIPFVSYFSGLSGNYAKNSAVLAATDGFAQPLPAQPLSSAHTFNDWNYDEIIEEMGPGWNLGNALDAGAEGISWSSRSRQTIFTAVHDLGFGNVRIPVTWEGNFEKINGVWTINKDWLSRVQDIVDYAINVGLYVVINTHHDSRGDFSIIRDTTDINGNGDKTEIIDLIANGNWLGKAIFGKTLNDAGNFIEHSDLTGTVKRPESLTTLISRNYNNEAWEDGKKIMHDIWTQIAAHFKDYDEHLIFESMNEPALSWYDLYGHRTHDAINELNQIFTDSIRAVGGNNSNRWLIVSGAYTGLVNNGTLIGMDTEVDNGHWEASFKLPTDKICNNCHIHVGNVTACPVCHAVTSFPTDAQGRFMLSWHHYPAVYFQKNYTSRQDVMIPVRHIFERVNRLYSSRKIPVYLGEYGAQNKGLFESSNATSRALLNEMINMLSRLTGIIPVIWDNNQGGSGPEPYGLIDRSSSDSSQPYMPYAQPSIEGIMRGWYAYPVDKQKFAEEVEAANNTPISGTQEAITKARRLLVKDYCQSLAERADGSRYVQSEVNRIINIKTPSKISIASGQSFTVDAKCDYEMISLNHAAYDHLIWTSSNYAIATVRDGVIKAKAPGRVRITAYSNRSTRDGTRLSKVINVTVYPDTAISAQGGSIDTNGNAVVSIRRNGDGGSSTNCHYLDARLTGNPNDRLFYTSSIPSRVAVSSHGKIVPVYNSPESTPTVAYITISSASGLVKIVRIDILPISASDPIISPDTMTLSALTPSLELDADNTEGMIEIKSSNISSIERVVFVSSDPRFAFVNTAGIVFDNGYASANVIAAGTGSTIITAYAYGGASVSIPVTVSNFTAATDIPYYSLKINSTARVNNIRINNALPLEDYPADSSVKYLTFIKKQGYKAIVRINGKIIEQTSENNYPFTVESDTEIDILIRDESLQYFPLTISAPPMITDLRIDGMIPDFEYLPGNYELSFNTVNGYTTVVKVNGVIHMLRNNKYPLEITGKTLISITVEADIGQAFHTFAITKSVIISNVRINNQAPEKIYQTGLYELKFDIAKGFIPVITINGNPLAPNKNGDYIIEISTNTVVQLDAILQTNPNNAYYTGILCGVCVIASIVLIYLAFRRRSKA